MVLLENNPKLRTQVVSIANDLKKVNKGCLIHTVWFDGTSYNIGGDDDLLRAIDNGDVVEVNMITPSLETAENAYDELENDGRWD